jgi:acetyl esterase/lipase
MTHKAGLAVISVGYRIAPENPFPTSVQDCKDVALYMIENAEKEYGSVLNYIGGEVSHFLYCII